MSLSAEQKQALIAALQERLTALVAHGQDVAKLLNSGESAAGIIRSAEQLVLGEKLSDITLSPAKAAQWASLVPVLVNHAEMLVNGSLALPPEAILSKAEAAAFLACSPRTLQRYMDQRKIEFIKHGVGRSARVEFERSVLVAFREGHKVRQRKPGARSHP